MKEIKLETMIVGETMVIAGDDAHIEDMFKEVLKHEPHILDLYNKQHPNDKID